MADAEAGGGAGTRDQRKLHKWASDDQPRGFSDLHNLVLDPATLMVAWRRVRGNRGSRSAGIDGQTACEVEARHGVERFLSELREELRSGTFRPLAVKERAIPHYLMASDLETNGRPRMIGWHGTNTAGFAPIVRYPCRWRGRVARCTNGMGDSLRYVLAR